MRPGLGSQLPAASTAGEGRSHAEITSLQDQQYVEGLTIPFELYVPAQIVRLI